MESSIRGRSFPRMDYKEKNHTDVISNLLACTACGSPLGQSEVTWVCDNCGKKFLQVAGVFLTDEVVPPSFFDTEHENMIEGKKDQGTLDVFYTAQCQHLRELAATRSPGLIVDIGCGPTLPYVPPEGWGVVGVDPSLQSICKNDLANLKLQAKAQSMPIRSGSVDIVVCFYSIHHMTVRSAAQNRASVQAALKEMRRVLKPNGLLVVFEVNPRQPFLWIQQKFWGLAKSLLGRRLDAYFWGKQEFPGLVRESLGEVRIELKEFVAPAGAKFPPVINLPWLRIPRSLYPFSVSAYTIHAA